MTEVRLFVGCATLAVWTAILISSWPWAPGVAAALTVNLCTVFCMIEEDRDRWLPPR